MMDRSIITIRQVAQWSSVIANDVLVLVISGVGGNGNNTNLSTSNYDMFSNMSMMSGGRGRKCKI